MAYLSELTRKHGGRMISWASKDHNGKRFNLDEYLHNESAVGLRIYRCRPETMLKSVEAALTAAPADVLRTERFSSQLEEKFPENTAFNVVLARRGRTLYVSADSTVLDVVNKAGGNILPSCNKGVCGTCEVRVIEGVLEHRDVVLTPAERNENSLMMACVSRRRGKALTLDLW